MAFLKHSDSDLTADEKVTNGETLIHKHNVSVLLAGVIANLLQRSVDHDLSKLGEFERESFTKYTPRLASMEYGSDEYRQCLREMQPAIDHHYYHNSHHPEHYAGGINGMSLLDLIEMVLDWKAASWRGKNGDMLKSLEINKERFGISEQLYAVLQNTIIELNLAEMP
jgi:hypothetical protein